MTAEVRTKWAERMLRIDRRAIFVLIGLCTLLPLLYPFGLPVKVSPEVRAVYDHIESLPEGAVLLISFDFEPSGKPELYPQAQALLRHAFERNLRVLGMTLWVGGAGMADQVMATVAQEMGQTYGEDYAFLGWSPGVGSLIISMGQDLFKAFPSDYYNRPTRDLSVLEGVRTLNDVDYVVSLAAGVPGVETWYVFGKDKYAFELGGGSTGVMAPGLYPLLRSGQINGLIGGLRGAAEYETLIGHPARATAGMDAQSVTHVAIVGLVLLCNLFYVMAGRPGRVPPRR